MITNFIIIIINLIIVLRTFYIKFVFGKKRNLSLIFPALTNSGILKNLNLINLIIKVELNKE